MPVRNLLIAAALLAVLGGAVWWSERSGGSTTTKKDETAAPELIKLSTDDVTRIVITRGTGQPEATIERSADGKWQISAPEGLRGSKESIDQLLGTFTGLRWDRLLEQKAADLAGFGLEPPALRVTVTAKNGTSRTLRIGDQTPSGNAWYASLEGDPRLFTVSDFTKGALDKQIGDLRDKQLLTFDTAKLQRVEVQKPGGLIEFTKSGDRWTISKPEPYRADNYEVEGLVDKVHGARMDVNVSPEDRAGAPARFASGSRVAIVNAVTSDGAQTLEVRKAGEHYFARSSVTEGVHRLEGDLGEALNKDLPAYRNRKLFDFGFTDPGKVEIKDGAATYTFSKSGEKWVQNGKTVDSVGVQSLIDKLRDLSAQDFGGPAVTAPELTMSVTADGKTETVIASGGAAQRAGEPIVYKVDPKTLGEIRQAAKGVKPAPPAAAK